MATAIGNTYLTLLDYAKRVDPDGMIGDIIEVLVASNPIIADANVLEGNLPTGHRFIQRTTEPTGTWRLLNSGVSPEKSNTKQVTENVGILEAYSKVDVDLAKLGGNAPSFRASEDNAFISGMNSNVATTLFYGNSGTDPEEFDGLSPRYSDLTGDYANQIINAGGSGDDNTSIWFITWGPMTSTLIFPKGDVAGLSSEDLGKILVQDVNNATKMYQAWVTKFQWKIGLAIPDYRYVIRIANIDVSDLTADAASGADLLDKMTTAYYARPTVDLGNQAKSFIYCNKTIAEFLHKQSQNKGNVNLSITMPAGQPQVNFLGFPVRVCDNIVSTEDTVN